MHISILVLVNLITWIGLLPILILKTAVVHIFLNNHNNEIENSSKIVVSKLQLHFIESWPIGELLFSLFDVPTIGFILFSGYNITEICRYSWYCPAKIFR